MAATADTVVLYLQPMWSFRHEGIASGMRSRVWPYVVRNARASKDLITGPPAALLPSSQQRRRLPVSPVKFRIVAAGGQLPFSQVDTCSNLSTRPKRGIEQRVDPVGVTSARIETRRPPVTQIQIHPEHPDLLTNIR
jgi:hypothetical protein